MASRPLRVVVLDPEPPPGVEVYYYNSKGQPCKPSEAVAYTWESAPKWFKVIKPEEKE